MRFRLRIRGPPPEMQTVTQRFELSEDDAETYDVAREMGLRVEQMSSKDIAAALADLAPSRSKVLDLSRCPLCHDDLPMCP